MPKRIFNDSARKGKQYYALDQDKKTLLSLLNNSQKLNTVQGGMV